MEGAIGPGPSRAEMLALTPRALRDPLGFLEQTLDRWGGLVALPVGDVPALLVHDPAAATELLTAPRGWSKRTIQYAALAEVTGQGLLTSDGSVWREHRRVLQPAFARARLAGVLRHSVAAAQRVAGDWDARLTAAARGAAGFGGPPADALRGAAVVDVEDAMLGAALEVVGSALLGVTLPRPLVHAVQQALDVVIARSRVPVPVPSWAPTPGNRAMRRARAVIDAAAADALRRRVDHPALIKQPHPALIKQSLYADSPGEGTGDPEDVLGLLIAAREGDALAPRGAWRLGGPEALRDEIVTMIVAGHETVASALTWTWWLLARHPEIQAAVATEARAALDRGVLETGRLDPATGGASAAGYDVPPGAAHDASPRATPAAAHRGGDPHALRAVLAQLSLTRRVFEESLRLYPPAWVISRRAEEPNRVGRLGLPAGTLAVVSPWVLHRDARRWDNPTRFDPARFDPERTGTPLGVPRSAYLPFGAGPRLCIGRDVALVEGTVMLAVLAARFEVRPAANAPVRVRPLVTLRPAGGMPLQVHSR